MGNWRFTGVAALAVFQTIVIDDEGCPVGGVMAAGAIFTGMVGGRFVAGGAVGVTGVVEYGRFPILCIMTGGTFKVVMRGWIIFQVAGKAVVVAQVVKGCVSPIFGIGVAVDTRAWLAGMVYAGLHQITAETDGWEGRVKQAGFCDWTVVPRRVIGGMAGKAFKDGHMFVIFDFPAFGVGVAVAAGAGVVAARVFLPVTGVTFANGRMVKFQRRPTVNGMAVGAFPGKMVGIVVSRCGLVAACAVGGGVGVTAVFMTQKTFNTLVAAAKGEVCVFNILPQERYDNRIDPGGRFEFIRQCGNQLFR